MKISQNSTENLTFTININIVEEDYKQKHTKILNDYRKKAEIKGFRKGMTPMSIIEKLHGRSALFDVVNELVSNALNDHIKSNNYNVIGEPLPSEVKGKEINWESDTEFEFNFDIAVAPEMNLPIDKSIKVVNYEPKLSEKIVAEYKSNLLKQYGTLVPTESVQDEDFVIADLVQGEFKVEDSYISLKNIEDSKIRKKFIGKKTGDLISIDIEKTFVNETDRAALLKVTKEELKNLDPTYDVVIKEVKRFTEAIENQDFYNRAFGKDVVSTKDEFNKKAEERLEEEFKMESEYRFSLDVRDTLIEKAGLTLPDNFLKRWLVYANEGKFTIEEIEKDYNLFAKDLRWQLIRGSVIKNANLQITKELMLEQARRVASYQYSMYGLSNVPQDQIDQFANYMISDEKESRRIYEKVEDDLAINFIKDQVTLNPKKITIEELRKLTN